MIELPRDAGWEAALDLSERLPDGWTLIGARMVDLHAHEHEATPPRSSLDFDVLAPVRMLPDAVETVCRHLTDAGFDFDGANAANIGHRFRKEKASVDVLAPDGVNDPDRLRTVGGARTVEVPGGTQALSRTDSVRVRVAGREGALPRPSLLGAILIKARAVDVDDLPDAQLRDLAFLLTLLEDPFESREELRRTERTWLRRREDLGREDHPAWRGLDGAEDGRLAYSVLTAADD